MFPSNDFDGDSFSTNSFDATHSTCSNDSSPARKDSFKEKMLQKLERRRNSTASDETDFSEDQSDADINQSPSWNLLDVWSFEKEEIRTGEKSASASAGGGNDTSVVSRKHIQPVDDTHREKGRVGGKHLSETDKNNSHRKIEGTEKSEKELSKKKRAFFRRGKDRRLAGKIGSISCFDSFIRPHEKEDIEPYGCLTAAFSPGRKGKSGVVSAKETKTNEKISKGVTYYYEQTNESKSYVSEMRKEDIRDEISFEEKLQDSHSRETQEEGSSDDFFKSGANIERERSSLRQVSQKGDHLDRYGKIKGEELVIVGDTVDNKSGLFRARKQILKGGDAWIEYKEFGGPDKLHTCFSPSQPNLTDGSDDVLIKVEVRSKSFFK